MGLKLELELKLSLSLCVFMNLIRAEVEVQNTIFPDHLTFNLCCISCLFQICCFWNSAIQRPACNMGVETVSSIKKWRQNPQSRFLAEHNPIYVFMSLHKSSCSSSTFSRPRAVPILKAAGCDHSMAAERIYPDAFAQVPDLQRSLLCYQYNASSFCSLYPQLWKLEGLDFKLSYIASSWLWWCTCNVLSLELKGASILNVAPDVHIQSCLSFVSHVHVHLQLDCVM